MRIVLSVALLVIAHAAFAATSVVDDAALANEAGGRDWAAHGRTFSESRYSPLTEINRDTVARLNLAWTRDLDVTDAESTPLAVDGVLYVAAGYSLVHARGRARRLRPPADA